MRHRRTVKTLGRTSAHRKATLANLASALFEHKHIQTTEAKARVARRMAERLITLAKKGTLHARRHAFRLLRQKHAVKVLFDDVAPRYKERPGGYTRLVKLGQRTGDGAPVAVLELVGYEPAVKKQKEKQAKAEEKEKKAAKKEKAQAKEASAAKDAKKPAKEAKKESKKEEKKDAKKEKAKAESKAKEDKKAKGDKKDQAEEGKKGKK
jgi:large subunit ribosomal protein L17